MTAEMKERGRENLSGHDSASFHEPSRSLALKGTADCGEIQSGTEELSVRMAFQPPKLTKTELCKPVGQIAGQSKPHVKSNPSRHSFFSTCSMFA
jgi:hypothetical protein